MCDSQSAWLQFDGDLIGQGKDAAQKALAEKPDLAKKIVEAIMAKRALPVAAFVITKGQKHPRTSCASAAAARFPCSCRTARRP